MISTRGRYALRVMLDLAENGGAGYVPMKEVAARQGVSLKYLEQIMPALVKAGCVEGIHGRGGGYRLAGPPEAFSVGEVLRLAEGDLAPVACLQPGAAPCPRAKTCRTLPMWREYYRQTNAFFDGMTLADLLGAELPGEAAEEDG